MAEVPISFRLRLDYIVDGDDMLANKAELEQQMNADMILGGINEEIKFEMRKQVYDLWWLINKESPTISWVREEDRSATQS